MFKRLIRSFRSAFRGIILTWREELSFKIQTIIAAAVIILVFFLKLKIWETTALLLLIILVLVLELLNSVVERIIDVLKPRIHPYVEDIKDIMAGTVLVAAIGALVVGLIILWPYIFR